MEPVYSQMGGFVDVFFSYPTGLYLSLKAIKTIGRDYIGEACSLRRGKFHGKVALRRAASTYKRHSDSPL